MSLDNGYTTRLTIADSRVQSLINHNMLQPMVQYN